MVLPRLPFERILKRAGAKRVSKSAIEEMAKVLEEKLGKIVVEATLLAKHAGRKTITSEDIRLARKKLQL